MTVSYERIDTAKELGASWDALAQDVFQERFFLRHCEKYNPCAQRYYCMRRGGELVAGAVCYTLPIDLLTYLRCKSPVRMRIIGIPCSVSSPGLTGDRSHHAGLLSYMARHERGLLLCLNVADVPETTSFVTGRTLPTIVVDGRFATWNDYRSSLRSHYRRRLAAVEAAAEKFEIVSRHGGAAFTDEMQAMYEAVYRRSTGKLEKLSGPFFRNLPDAFTFTTYATAGRVVGWTSTVRGGNDRCHFFLGGQDYSYDPVTVYLVKLLTVLRQGIESGARAIDLGQSAEVPKMRFGGKPAELRMLAYHRNPLIRAALRWGIGLLSYKGVFPSTSCFSEGGRQ